MVRGDWNVHLGTELRGGKKVGNFLMYPCPDPNLQGSIASICSGKGFFGRGLSLITFGQYFRLKRPTLLQRVFILYCV